MHSVYGGRPPDLGAPRRASTFSSRDHSEEGLSVIRSVGRSVGRTAGRSVGRSVGGSVGRSVCQSANHHGCQILLLILFTRYEEVLVRRIDRTVSFKQEVRPLFRCPSDGPPHPYAFLCIRLSASSIYSFSSFSSSSFSFLLHLLFLLLLLLLLLLLFLLLLLLLFLLFLLLLLLLLLLFLLLLLRRPSVRPLLPLTVSPVDPFISPSAPSSFRQSDS